MAAPIKPDFWAVALDVTASYFISEEHRPYIKAIKDVFFYDQNSQTHLCEATPSFYLNHLHTFVEFNENTPDEMQDKIDQAYCYEPTDDSYMHCSDVERLPQRVQYDATGKEEQDEEIVREYWQGNYPF